MIMPQSSDFRRTVSIETGQSGRAGHTSAQCFFRVGTETVDTRLIVETPTRFSGLRETLMALALMVFAAVAAYHNSLHGPFIFDDALSIVENPDIRHLATTLRENPETGATLVGRPMLRLSLWINYALGGYEVRGYHLLNLALHILAAWTLWGLVRRVFESPRLKDSYGKEASALSLAIALIWTVHPLQTESVTYVIQRAEILGGLFYLLTLYSVVRSIDAIGWSRLAWYSAALVSCLLGMASKETAATAPLVAVAMDRVFWSPSFKRLWQARKRLYLVLACTWIPLAMLMSVSSQRMGSAGFGLGVDWWEYALTQPYYLCRYLALSVWPSALTLDYGFYLARTVREIAPYAAFVFVLAVLTLAALWRNSALGFCGLWFFLILGPTSSVVPLVTQTGAEHRMYLPLAGLIGLGVVGGHAFWRRVYPGRPEWLRAVPPVLVVALAVAALAARTVVRNEDYRSRLSIWQTVVDQWPANPRAHINLGSALASAGRLPEAIAHYEDAIRLKPDYLDAHYSLGNALATAGQTPEAIAEYEEVLRLDPDDDEAHSDLGDALTRVGRPRDAVVQYEEALRLNPDSAEIHYNLGYSLATVGRATEAVAQYEEALRLEPDFADAYNNLAWLRATDSEARNRNGTEAVRLAKQAVLLEDTDPNYLDTLAAAYAEAGQFSQAVSKAESALELARPSGNVALVNGIETRLALYRGGRSFHREP